MDNIGYLLLISFETSVFLYFCLYDLHQLIYEMIRLFPEVEQGWLGGTQVDTVYCVA